MQAEVDRVIRLCELLATVGDDVDLTYRLGPKNTIHMLKKPKNVYAEMRTLSSEDKPPINH